MRLEILELERDLKETGDLKRDSAETPIETL